jgi:hypothetical protein
VTGVSRRSVASIGGSLFLRLRPNRRRRIEFESFAVIADGRWQLAFRRRKFQLGANVIESPKR